jgi:hypothetical protein
MIHVLCTKMTGIFQTSRSGADSRIGMLAAVGIVIDCWFACAVSVDSVVSSVWPRLVCRCIRNLSISFCNSVVVFGGLWVLS